MQASKHGPLGRREIDRENGRMLVNRTKERRRIKRGKRIMKRVLWNRELGRVQIGDETGSEREEREQVRRGKGRGPAVLLHHSVLAGVKKE